MSVPYKLISAASTNSTLVVAYALGKIRLMGLQASNVNAAVRYLKIYDKSTAPIVGTDIPVKTIALTGGTTGNLKDLNFNDGIEFSSGIGIALTTGVANTDTAAVAANEIVVNLDYNLG